MKVLEALADHIHAVLLDWNWEFPMALDVSVMDRLRYGEER